MKRISMKALLCAALIAILALAPVSALAANTVQIYIVKINGARLRTGANRTTVVTSLKKGQRVVYAGRHDGAMYYVRTAGGRTGYIYKEYLKPYGAATRSQIFKTTRRTTMYRNRGSGHLRTLSKGTTVIVYQRKGQWAYIKTLRGTSGYVKLSSIQRA